GQALNAPQQPPNYGSRHGLFSWGSTHELRRCALSSLKKVIYTVGLPGGTRESRLSKNYYVDIVGADGVRRKIPVGPDKAAAIIRQGELEREVALGKAHAVDPYRESLLIPLEDQLDAYNAHHVQKGTTRHHRQNATSRCKRAFGAMGARTL